jgi:hypothetical protein
MRVAASGVRTALAVLGTTVLTLAAPPVARAQEPPGRIWITAGPAFGTVRGDCQDCEQDFAYRHDAAFAGNGGYRVNSRMDVGADVFWMRWKSASGKIESTHFDAVAQFRPWGGHGFFLKGGAGMAFVRNWVHTLGPHPDNSKALSVVIGGGWEFRSKGPIGLQLFATQHVGALGDLQTTEATLSNVTGNFWSIGAAIVIR